MGRRRVRVANLPSDVPDRLLKDTMSKHGDVKHVTEEKRTRIYTSKYPVSNGIQLVELEIKQHIPSHMLIVGYLSHSRATQQPVMVAMRLDTSMASAPTEGQRPPSANSTT